MLSTDSASVTIDIDGINVIDYFAAGGGWDEAMRMLGRTDVLGVEFNKAACATATAAGHRRVLADVRALRPHLRFGMVEGFISSSPCQSFSMAGRGEGRDAMAALHGALAEVAFGATPEDALAMFGNEKLDERSALALEPMVFIREVRPRWVAMENVPAVLPLWQAYGRIMESLWGYNVAVDNLQAEQYGVPQTRKRAILVASLDGPVELPTPTHSKYHNRTPAKLDEGVEKWVSMAEALGWGMSDLVGFPRITDGVGGVVEIDGVDYRARDLRAASEPSAVVTGKSRSWKRWEMGDVRSSHGTMRRADQPAPTLTASMDNGNYQWRERVVAEVEPRVNNQSGTHFDLAWPCDRPAPTIAGREIVTMPGANANRFNGSTKSRNDGIRVSVSEAAVLQSFRPDYPWQGTKTQQYQQVGDAIPPLLARAVLEPLIASASVSATGEAA